MGDIMKELDRAEELLCKGIKEITDRDMLDASSLDNLKDAILGVEKIYKTRHYASEDDKDRNGYSLTYRPDSRFPMTYPMMYQYGDNEYDTRHSHNMNYDNNGMHTDRYNGYSRGSMLEHLEKALNEASTEQEREAIRRIIADRK